MTREASAMHLEASPAERRTVAFLSAVAAGFGIWRVSLGADLGDGTHVVALAMRLAQGDRPLVDEMNLQVFGSITAVPFTWVWIHVVGVEAIVLASRLWYLAVLLGCAALVYRALRTFWRPLPAATATLFILVPTPYNLLVTSYNTMPVLMLAVAACAAAAALVGQTGQPGRWAALCGLALAVAVVSHPGSIGAAAMLAVVTLILAGHRGRPRTVRVNLLLAGVGASLIIVAIVLITLGADALRDTLEFTRAYQSQRPDPDERVKSAVSSYRGALLVPAHIPAALLALTAAAAPRRWQGPASAGVVLTVAAATWTSVLRAEEDAVPFGSISPAFALLVIPLLLVPVVVWAVLDDDDEVRVLLALTVPTALVGSAILTMTSSASAYWGPAAAAFLPLFAVLVSSSVSRVHREYTHRESADRPTAKALLAATTVAVVMSGALLGTHTLRSFRDPSPDRLVARVESGPLAGLLTQQRYLGEDCELSAVTSAAIRPGESVLFYGAPAGYAYTSARMDSNILWLSAFGAANAATVDWMMAMNREPDVVVVSRVTVERAGGWDRVVAEDPFIATVDAEFAEPVRTQDYYVFRRDGQRTAIAWESCPPR